MKLCHNDHNWLERFALKFDMEILPPKKKTKKNNNNKNEKTKKKKRKKS